MANEAESESATWSELLTAQERGRRAALAKASEALAVVASGEKARTREAIRKAWVNAVQIAKNHRGRTIDEAIEALSAARNRAGQGMEPASAYDEPAPATPQPVVSSAGNPNTELSPCAFCGRRKQFLRLRMEINAGGAVTVYVLCVCSARGPDGISSDRAQAQANAENGWNRRAPIRAATPAEGTPT